MVKRRPFILEACAFCSHFLNSWIYQISHDIINARGQMYFQSGKEAKSKGLQDV